MSTVLAQNMMLCITTLHIIGVVVAYHSFLDANTIIDDFDHMFSEEKTEEKTRY